MHFPLPRPTSIFSSVAMGRKQLQTDWSCTKQTWASTKQTWQTEWVKDLFPIFRDGKIHHPWLRHIVQHAVGEADLQMWLSWCVFVSLQVCCCELGSQHAYFLHRERSFFGAQTLLPPPQSLLPCHTLASWYVNIIKYRHNYHLFWCCTTLEWLSLVRLTWRSSKGDDLLLTNCGVISWLTSAFLGLFGHISSVPTFCLSEAFTY